MILSTRRGEILVLLFPIEYSVMTEHIKVRNEDGETLKAGCVIVNEKNEVLLITDRERRKWAFPKGHAEIGETLEETAVREVQEETGYRVEVVKKLADVFYTNEQTGERVRLALFQARPLSVVSPGEEGVYPIWVSLDEAHVLLYVNLALALDKIQV